MIQECANMIQQQLWKEIYTWHAVVMWRYYHEMLLIIQEKQSAAGAVLKIYNLKT